MSYPGGGYPPAPGGYPPQPTGYPPAGPPGAPAPYPPGPSPPGQVCTLLCTYAYNVASEKVCVFSASDPKPGYIPLLDCVFNGMHRG